MKYRILQGSLEYSPHITKEIFEHLIMLAESKGCAFNKHFGDGGNTYEHFKRNKYLNFDVTGKRYNVGKCYVVDNNPQRLPILSLEDLQVKEENPVINSYSIY